MNLPLNFFCQPALCLPLQPITKIHANKYYIFRNPTPVKYRHLAHSQSSDNVYLSFARPDGSVGVGLGAADTVGTIRHSLLGSRLPVLRVGREVEADEEEKVGRDNAYTGVCGIFLTSTLSGIGNVRPVGRGKVSVRSEVDEAYAIHC